MKVSMTVLILAMSAFPVTGCTDAADHPEPPDLTGNWTGYAIAGDGTQLNFTMTLDIEEDGYSGMLHDMEEAIPDIVLRNINVEDGTLSFDLDFPTDQGSDLIRVTLHHRNGTLSGSYTDPSGDSDRVSFRRDGGA